MYLFPDQNKSINGILSYFKSIHRTNEYEAITNSETVLKERPKENILDISTPSYWASEESSIIWIGVAFRYHSVKVSNYTLRQYSGAGNMPKIWTFQGSNDGEQWYDLDYRNSPDYCINGTILDTFSVPQENQSFYKKYRLYKSGEDCLSSRVWRLSGIELFGIVDDYNFKDNIIRITINTKIIPDFRKYTFIFILFSN